MASEPCRLQLKVVPSSSWDAIVGWLGKVLKVKVKVMAPPEKGLANGAVEALLAKTLGLSSKSVSIVSGHSSPTKTVEITIMCQSDVLRLLPAASVK